MSKLKKITLEFVRTVYRALPMPVKKKLAPLRWRLANRLSGMTDTLLQERTPQQLNDIDWPTFRDTVLSQRDRYKGVFIQNATIDWNVPLFQRPQQMCIAFGKIGYLVIYRTLNFGFDDVIGFRHMGNNVWLTNSPEIDGIRDAVRSVYSTVDPAPPSVIADLRKKGKVVYEYIDHIDEAVSGEARLSTLANARDLAFAGGVDYIVASARALEEEALAKRPRSEVLYIPNGVDCEHYRRELVVDFPDHYKAFLNRYDKIVGYFGAMAGWLWYDLIEEVVQRRSDYGFVFIGADYMGESKRLPKVDNLLWLGSIDYKILPAYAREFDVAIIPFAHGEVAKTTSPLKLFEYFALETPVVVTSSMKECCAYSDVLSADNADEYIEAIDRAFILRENEEYRQKLAWLADQNDWVVRAQAMEPVFNALKAS
ncbi:glycosyltransferase [Bordetella petrii]|uniref:glycosyltransferase n=1 Tax=Bordetella petrii TaxID=94624 RepID=UPI0018CBF63D|nr:glycosyltransferase [Bordetella petrii]